MPKQGLSDGLARPRAPGRIEPILQVPSLAVYRLAQLSSPFFVDRALTVRRFTPEVRKEVPVSDNSVTPTPPEVLFVCVHNAGRSQMAAVLTASLSGGQVLVRSAGSAPGKEIHPNVRTVMAEVGLDLSQEFPKPLTDEAVQAADVVITMGCGDACPFYPGKQYLDWELTDPAGQPIEVVRQVRDDIHDRVLGLLADLGVEAAPLTSGGAGRE